VVQDGIYLTPGTFTAEEAEKIFACKGVTAVQHEALSAGDTGALSDMGRVHLTTVAAHPSTSSHAARPRNSTVPFE